MEINQFKDMVLPPIDDLVQSTNLFLERMPIEVKIPRQEFEQKEEWLERRI